MVFVSALIILSVVITLVIGLFYLTTFHKLPLLSKEIERRFLAIYSNVLVLYLVTFIAAFQTKTSVSLALILLTYASYSQSWLWSMGVEQRLVNISIKIRKKTLDQLTKDKYYINLFNAHRYIYALLLSEVHNFKNMFKDSIEEIEILLGRKEYSYKTSPTWKEIYERYKKFFKCIIIDFEKLANPYETDEEVLKAGAALKKNRDPRVMFNSLRRFPWRFKYIEEPNLFYQYVAKHSIVFYNFFKTTALAVFLMFTYFLYTIFFFKIQFLKQLSVWFVIGMLYFWLMSGFNFFVKRYQYGKFTSQIQRFWKRTNTSFWLIEGFLILLFFYYYLNSSQEPLYMYDYSAINQEFLVSLQTIGINIVLLSLVIYFMYFTLLRINSNSWTQLNIYLLLISVFIFFSFFIETYQFYYVISTFNERLWVLNEDEGMWGIETDSPILRTKHQYLFVCLIAKYWHFLFIFLSWVFFLIKSFERRKVTYVLFGANLQNMIILYVLNFACYIQWFKWVYRRFFDLPYTWFFTNIDNKFIFRLFFEIKLLFINLISFNSNVITLNSIIYKSLTLWGVDSLCVWKFI